jgi:hypothetical protein
MTIINIDPKIVRLRKEILPWLQRDMEMLARISEASYPVGSEGSARVIAKIAAIQKVIDEQGERLVNLRSEDDAFNLIAMIEMAGKYDGASAGGTNQATYRIMSYLR